VVISPCGMWYIEGVESGLRKPHTRLSWSLNIEKTGLLQVVDKGNEKCENNRHKC
jgi:hypothetical protein